MRSSTCFLWILILTVGCVLEDQPVGDGDAGICGSCPTPRPVCHEETKMCVECTTENSTQCTADAPVCDPETFECVGCVTSSDCNDPDEARCDTEANECVGCEGMADCEGIAGLPACNNGTCVQCTSDTNCNGKSCNTNTFECTNTDVGSLETCEECVADSECGESEAPSDDHRCVPMFYDDMRFPDDATGFCLKIFSPGGCQQPYAITIPDRQSLSDPQARSYCGINEILATCPAVRALVQNDPCPGGENTECPVSGLCRDVGGLPDRCTYPCGLPAQCPADPPADGCGSPGSGGEDYCGG